MTAARQKSPSTARNREPIAAVLAGVLPAKGLVLEIASGAGEHAIFLAQGFPALTFQPSDPSPAARESIAAWIRHDSPANVLPPLAIDASAERWSLDSASAFICINMIHISPWAATQGLLRNAARLLGQGAPLYLYGPYRREGVETAPSNEAFDEDLKRRNAAWGLRDLETVAALAQEHGFGAPVVTEMPANNLSLVFRKLA